MSERKSMISYDDDEGGSLPGSDQWKKVEKLRSLRREMELNSYKHISDFLRIHSEFNSSLQLFHQQEMMNIVRNYSELHLFNTKTDQTTVSQDLADTAMFLAKVYPLYSEPCFLLADFPSRLLYLLTNYSTSIPSTPRLQLARALTRLHPILSIERTLFLFIKLQTLGDKKLTNLASSHVFSSLWRLHDTNEHRTQNLQTQMFDMLEGTTEAVKKTVLVTLWNLYKREVWFDENTADAICTAAFHPALGIMTAALSSLLQNKPMIDNDKDHDHSDTNDYHDSPLNRLTDKQGFAERLFSRLHQFKEGSEVHIMMLKLTARVIGLHQLTFLKFYPYVQKYIQPHQPDIINLLAAVVEACHDKVPRDAVKPLFIQIINQFVYDRSRPEAITIGLNAAREICIHMPLLMNDDLLQDLDLYEKSHQKADSVAVQSLITLFQEFRPFGTKARQKAYEEVDFATDVPGDELLTDSDEEDDSDQEDDQMTIDDESLGTKS